MIEHIAMMMNTNEKWVDVFYNKQTKEVYQETLVSKRYQQKSSNGYILLGSFKTRWEAEVYLEKEFGSNVELD